MAAGLIHSAVEDFAGELATVARRFLQLDEWKDTEHIVMGGGLSGSHIGRLAIDGRSGGQRLRFGIRKDLAHRALLAPATVQDRSCEPWNQ